MGKRYGEKIKRLRCWLLGVLLLTTLLIFMIFPQTAATLAHIGVPRIDEILFKAYPGAPEDVIVDELLAGVTDMIPGPTRKDLYDHVTAAGYNVSLESGFYTGIMVFNCREDKSTSGEPNFPLNDSAFRLAVSYIYGVNDKMDDIYGYVEAPWKFAIGNPVPPAQEPWYDDMVQMPDTDYDVAWYILEAAGYYVDPTENWLYRDGTKIRNMNVWYPTGALFWQHGPGSGFVTAFNEFITTHLSADGPTLTVSPVSFTTLFDELLVYRDFDIVCVDLFTADLFPDWLYAVLHSGNDFEWGWNLAGIHDPQFDVDTGIILTSLDVTEILETSSRVQSRFVYELMPWFPVCAGLVLNTFDPDLVNVMGAYGFGADNDWTWKLIHWSGSCGGTVKRALAGEPVTLSPVSEGSVQGWQIMGNVLDSTPPVLYLSPYQDATGMVYGLVHNDPTDLGMMPWIAYNWTIQHYVAVPELGIPGGTKVTYYLRNDVKWHDGTPFTAYDCEFAWNLLMKYHVGRYSQAWANLVYCEAREPYKVTAYLYDTSSWALYQLAATATLFPKHIWTIVDEMVQDETLSSIYDFQPAYTAYKDITGDDPPAQYPFLKALVGVGPYVFDYYDPSLAVGRLAKFDEYWISSPVVACVDAPCRIDPDTSVNYSVLLQNMGAETSDQIGELVEATVDVNVYVDGNLEHVINAVVVDLFDEVWLGPYNTGPLAYGLHNITVEIYEEGGLIHTYTHEIYATIKEDINLDLKVDMMDVMIVVNAYESYPGHSRWDPKADVIEDFLIDDFDVCLVCGQFGWAGGPHIAGDVAVANVWPSKRRVELGETVDVYVEVENQGPTGCAAFYVNATLTYEFLSGITRTIDLGTQTVVLNSGTSTVLTFVWNPTVEQIGWYKISAYATAVPYESDTADNTYVDRKIAFTPLRILSRGVGKGKCLLCKTAFP